MSSRDDEAAYFDCGAGVEEEEEDEAAVVAGTAGVGETEDEAEDDADEGGAAGAPLETADLADDGLDEVLLGAGLADLAEDALLGAAGGVFVAVFLGALAEDALPLLLDVDDPLEDAERCEAARGFFTAAPAGAERGVEDDDDDACAKALKFRGRSDICVGREDENNGSQTPGPRQVPYLI